MRERLSGTLGEQAVRLQWGGPDSAQNPRIQFSDRIEEKSKEKKRYCIACTVSQPEQQARPS